MSNNLTKPQFFAELAQQTGMSKADAKKYYEGLCQIVQNRLKSGAAITLPDLLKLTVVNKPATEARKGRNPFNGQEMVIPAKPAFKKVKAAPVKALKEVVA